MYVIKTYMSNISRIIFMGGRVIVCPASMSDWRYMKQVIYKVFKVSIIVALVALILFFIVNRIPGGKSLINNTKERKLKK